MLTMYSEREKPESYKGYKNRTTTKLTERAKNLKQSIASCSLKGEDKNKLIEQIISLFQG